MTLRLRTSVFRERMQHLGFDNPQARARAIGMHRSTLVGCEEGRYAPGECLVASVLTALPDMTFEDLFEIVPAKGAA